MKNSFDVTLESKNEGTSDSYLVIVLFPLDGHLCHDFKSLRKGIILLIRKKKNPITCTAHSKSKANLLTSKIINHMPSPKPKGS